MYCRFGKRALDVAVSLLLLVVLAPVIALVAMLVWTRLGRPVLFRQQRPGLHEMPFTILKFRTMSDGRDEAGHLLPDDARLGAFGSFLRAMSLDELPELWNVLTGDMSLVGPRPLLVEYLPRYTKAQRRRHDVRPGITGLAQIRGRNELRWERKFALDIQYVDSRSFLLDLRIIAKTALAVVGRRGISHAGHATAPEFMGSTQTK